MTRRSRADGDVRILESALGSLPPANARPALVLLSGLPGSGKSYLAREICRGYPIAHVESDVLRKELFARPVYTPRESTRLFAAIHALVGDLLDRGLSVLFDATNLKEAHRRPLYDIAKRRGARLVIVRVEVPDSVARQRLEAKRRGGDPGNHSDADVDIYEAMRRAEEPIGREHIRVETSGSVAPAVDKIVGELEEIA